MKAGWLGEATLYDDHALYVEYEMDIYYLGQQHCQCRQLSHEGLQRENQWNACLSLTP